MFSLLGSKQDMGVHGVDVLQELVVSVFHFLDAKGIIHIPSPKSGGWEMC